MAYVIREDLGWFETRWLICTAADSARGDRLWAGGEIVCAILTIATLAVAVGAVVADPFFDIPWFLRGWPMTLLLSSAVGYGTNFLAVQMLFKPRERTRNLLLRWVWPQGLVPAKQSEIAEVVGAEVAHRLLTPEVIVEELTRIVEIALEDEKTFEELRRLANDAVSRELPAMLRRFLPDVLRAVEDAMQESLPPEEVRRILIQVIDEWFQNSANHQALARSILVSARAFSPSFIEMARASVRRYTKKSTIKRWALDGRGLLDWDELEKAFRRQLETDKSRRWAVELVSELGARAHEIGEALIRPEMLDSLKRRTGTRALDLLVEAAEQTLVPRLIELIESPSFKAYLLDDLLPRAKPRLIAWLAEGRLDSVVRRFDVAARVADSARKLSVAELEHMANRVGAYHLAAIQVLGYVLGMIVGVLACLIAVAD